MKMALFVKGNNGRVINVVVDLTDDFYKLFEYLVSPVLLSIVKPSHFGPLSIF